MNPNTTTVQIAQHIGMLTIQLAEAQARIAELEAQLKAQEQVKPQEVTP